MDVCDVCVILLLLSWLVFLFYKLYWPLRNWISPEQVRMFVDNSNLSIGALENNISVDLKKLKGLLSRKRGVFEAILYGSYSAGSGNDSYWKAAKKNGFQVKKFERSERSHKEKEVDVSLACDIVERLYTTKNMIVVIVTGDRDMKPAVVKCLEKKVPVELWAFKGPLWGEYYDLAREYPDLLSVKQLDHEDITYKTKNA